MVWPPNKLAFHFSPSLPSSLPPPSIFPFPFPTEPPGVSLQPLHSLLYPSCLASIHRSVIHSLQSPLAASISHPSPPPSPLQWLLPLWALLSLCLGLLCENGVIVALLQHLHDCVYVCVHVCVCVIVGVWVICPSAIMSGCPTSIRTQAYCAHSLHMHQARKCIQ